MCNDGQGMRPSERLTTLKQILKQGSAKEQIYKNIEKATRATGEWHTDPDKVYLTIKARLLMFKEEPLERKRRLHNEWNVLSKGKDDCLTFEAKWDCLIAKLTTVGITKTPDDLYFDYLTKVGPELARAQAHPR